MSAREKSANPYQDPMTADDAANLHPLREGVFCIDPNPNKDTLPARWLYSHGLSDLDTVQKPAHYKGKGQVTQLHAVLEDGSEHKVNVGRPRHQVSPIAEVSTTGYTTSLEGFNLHHLLRSMELGFFAVKVSAERKWQDSLSQARTAYNMLQIANAIEAAEPEVVPSASVLTGVSRGAMIALGMRALAASQNHEIPYMNLVAPCYPRPATLGMPTLLQPGKEIASLGRHMISLPLKLLLKYPSSIDLSKEGLRYHAAAIPMLTSGEAGLFKDFIPKDAHGHMVTYHDDLMGMGEIWQEDYQKHPMIHVEDASDKGVFALNNHLRCINYDDLRLFSARQMRLAQELGRHTLPSQIDYASIDHALAA